MDLITEFLEEFESKETKYAYNRDLVSFCDYIQLKGIVFDSIKLRDLVLWSRTKDKSPSSRRCIAAVKSFFKYCYRMDYLNKDISKCLRVPKKNQIKVERHLPQQSCIEAILSAKGDTKLLLQLLFYLGLRLTECRTLHRNMIKERADGCLTFTVIGKGNKVRTVPMGPRTSALLKPILMTRKGFIFKGRHNKALSKSAASKRVNKVLGKYNASAHYLRHAFATISLRNKCDLATVSKNLGHASIATTSIYLHASDKGASTFLEL